VRAPSFSGVRARLSITPSSYARVATAALAALTLIVLTGAAVRLTGSGLGCPDWPKCYGRVIAPLETHAVIEYGNRLLSGARGLVAVAAGALAWLRRPFRRDLALLAVLLPLGVVAQAVLGGFTVRNHLAPGFVMAHFGLSMLILVAAVALAWRARREPGAPAAGGDRLTSWSTRTLLGVGAVTIFVGTAATAAGPHAGGMEGQAINRLDFRGAATLDWAIRQHARIAAAMGIVAMAVWLLARRRGAGAEVRRATSVVLGLMAAQGLVGTAQYLLELPAELVWVHVTLACLTWVAVLWSVAAAGSARRAPAGALARTDRPSLETVRS
jgi:cytochrome c oxidase assembly protein subunit 15